MCMRYVTPSEKKSHSLHREEEFLTPCYRRCQYNDFLCDFFWEIFKIVVVRNGNYLNVAGPNWPIVQECDQPIIPEDLVSGDV